MNLADTKVRPKKAYRRKKAETFVRASYGRLLHVCRQFFYEATLHLLITERGEREDYYINACLLQSPYYMTGNAYAHAAQISF